MTRLRFWLFILVLLFLYYMFSTDNPRLSTPYGEVEGFYYSSKNGNKTQVFLGVPFAQAENFERPSAYPSWSGIRQAKDFPKGCVPVHLSLGTDVSEDCLYLNIIKPVEDPDDPLGYPVLVFIHGGGFVGGSSGKYGYKSFSDHFASEKILVISVQYRVGFLGFSSTGDGNLPGNLGLWDLAFSLRFIKDLLPKLDGDPDRITVFGHSAGSAAAHALSTSPHTNGLFAQVIQSSASLFAEWAFNEQVVDNSWDFAEALGCQKSMSRYEVRNILKTKSVPEMLEAVEKTSIYKPNMRQFIFNPRLDGDFFPEPLEVLMEKAPKKPVLFGMTEVEWSKIVNTPYDFYNSIGVKDDVKSNFDDKAFIDYIDEYILEKSNTSETMKLRNALIGFFVTSDPQINLRNLVDIVSDLMFVVPTIQQIQLKNKIGDKSFLFYEKHSRKPVYGEIPIVPGGPHGNELFYIFDNERNGFDWDQEDFEFQKHIIEGIRNFVKSGKPSSGSVNWPNVGGGTRHVVLNPTPKIEEVFEGKRMNFWIDQLPNMVDIDFLRKTRLPFAQKRH